MKKIHAILAASLLPVGLFTASLASEGEDEPTIAKDSIQITAFTFNQYKKSYDM